MAKRVLVVEDDASIRTALKLRLQRDAFVVHTAADGDEALRAISAQSPDLVILDLTLPRRDGLDVLAQLKGSPATAHIPVIVLTARYQCSDDCPVFLTASAEVMAKPFSPRHLVERVHSLVSSPVPGAGERAPGLAPALGGLHTADAAAATGR